MIWKRLIPCCLLLFLFGCSKSTSPENRAPYKPHDPDPLDDSTEQPVNDELRWSGGDPDGDPVSYDVYFGTDPDPSLAASHVSGTQYDPGLLDTFTTYHWRIVARDTYGIEAQGNTWNFTTGNNPPFVPGDPDPPDSAVDQSILSTLSWTGGDPDGDTLIYYVYFGLSVLPPWVATVDSPGFDPGVLAYDTTYYWKVVARDIHNNIVESPVWSFMTWDTLPIPQNVGIVSDAEGDGVVVSWDQANSVDGYEIVTPDRDTIILNDDETSYTDDTPSQTGGYSVCTFRGSEKSPPETVSNTAYIGTFPVVLYVWSDPVQPAGFGWYPTVGNGTVFDCVDENRDSVDFFLNDSTAFFDLTSCDQLPYLGNKSTGILYMGTEDFFEAPVAGYISSIIAQEGGYYAIQVEGDYYSKVHILSVVSGVSATFSYEFQKIQYLRIF